MENEKVSKSKAIEKLKELIGEIPRLRTLKYDNQEFKPWCDRVKHIISLALDDDDYQKFVHTDWWEDMFLMGDDVHRGNYQHNLTSCKNTLQSIIDKYEILEAEIRPSPRDEPRTTSESPKAFIAHGGETKARNKLQKFLVALGVKPLIIEEEPQEGRSVNEQVEYYSKLADCAIILGTADDKELKDGKLYPRRNDFIEIGRFLEKFPNRIIYLLEEGASFPSIIVEKLRTPFTHESMDEAFTTIARELKTFGILKAAKPEKRGV